jgi:isopentenyldiphosphate isomerase
MTMASVDNELVDVIDEDGNVTGTVTRAEVREHNLRHRSVFVVVVNRANEVLVHRRADWKDVWPSAWDLAFGGVVESGEALEAAAGRELNEEAGITAELSYLGEDTYEDDTVRELARIYLARHDGPVSFDDGEVAEAAWVPIDVLRSWLTDRKVCPDSKALVIPRLDAP